MNDVRYTILVIFAIIILIIIIGIVIFTIAWNNAIEYTDCLGKKKRIYFIPRDSKKFDNIVENDKNKCNKKYIDNYCPDINCPKNTKNENCTCYVIDHKLLPFYGEEYEVIMDDKRVWKMYFTNTVVVSNLFGMNQYGVVAYQIIYNGNNKLFDFGIGKYAFDDDQMIFVDPQTKTEYTAKITDNPIFKNNKDYNLELD
jgi:hypothetical protein